MRNAPRCGELTGATVRLSFHNDHLYRADPCTTCIGSILVLKPIQQGLEAEPWLS